MQAKKNWGVVGKPASFGDFIQGKGPNPKQLFDIQERALQPLIQQLAGDIKPDGQISSIHEDIEGRKLDQPSQSVPADRSGIVGSRIGVMLDAPDLEAGPQPGQITDAMRSRTQSGRSDVLQAGSHAIEAGKNAEAESSPRAPKKIFDKPVGWVDDLVDKKVDKP